MRNFESKESDFIGAQRVSRRNQNGVEIFERETKRLALPSCSDDRETKPEAGSSPRLIIGDAISRSKLFISKRRSELSEVDTLLRNLLGRAIDVK